MEDLRVAPQRAVVTGGAGFIGSHVVARLLDLGCEYVLVVDDLSTGSPANLDGLDSPDVELEQLDIASPAAGEAIVGAAPEVVYHLAAQTDLMSSFRDPISDASTNVLGTLRVAEAATSVGACVVFSSTGGAMYGDVAAPASEYARPAPRSPYAISKLAGELYLLNLAGHVVLRYANVYGPRQLATAEGGVVAIFLDRIRRGERPVVYGDGHQTRDYVHVSDIADATVRAHLLSGRGSRIFNVGTGTATSLLKLLGLLDCTDVDFAPARPGELRSSVLDPARLAWSLPYGWKPRPLGEGLAGMVG